MTDKRLTRKAHTTEAELRALVEGEGLTFVQVSARLGIVVQAIRQCCSVLGIRSRYLPAGDVSRAAEYLEQIGNGDSLDEIGARYGVTRQAVHSALKRAGLPKSAREYLRAKNAAAVAQLAEQPPCSGQVASSILAGGSIGPRS